jgi:hypothetical protein
MSDGVKVTLDQWDTVPGDQLPEFMERAIRESDYVLIVCTPRYKERSDNRVGGAGYEGDIMTSELFASQSPQIQRKFIPILRAGKWGEAAPSWLQGKYRIHLDSDPYPEESYQDLLLTLHRARPKRPPLGSRPDFEARRSGSPSGQILNQPEALAPVTIKGVIVDEVGYPPSDGTRGSMLYSVPLQLSRRPSDEWASLFVEAWNHPPEFSTMHRPGIARIQGDRVVLTGTTLNEIEKHHRKTLLLVVEKVNRLMAEQEQRRHATATGEEAQRRKHQQEVAEVAERLSFNSAQPPPAVLNAATEAALSAIRESRPDMEARIKEFWKALLEALEVLNPNKGKGFEYSDFFAAVEKTLPANVSFARLATVAAEWNNERAAFALYEGFERLVQGYRQPRGYGGHYDPREFDFHKFVGHELCTTLFSLFIRERRWDVVANLLDELLHVENHPSGRPATATFEYIGESVMFFDNEELHHFARSHSVHAKILKERHTQGELGTLVPMRQFVDGDFFLNLRSVAAGTCDKDSLAFEWIPESVRYLDHSPEYLLKAKQIRHAKLLLKPLGVADIASLREAIKKQKAFVLGMFRGSYAPAGVAEIDPESIGTL